jgi:Ca-activated chloride channel family protein
MNTQFVASVCRWLPLEFIFTISSLLFVFNSSHAQIQETVNVELVEVFISAISHEDLPIEDLKQEDFILTVDKKRQTITHFSRILNQDSDVPLTIIFLVDTSGSMMEGELNARRIDLARVFALMMMKDVKSGDRIQILAFDETLRSLTPMTSDANQIEQSLSQLQFHQYKNTGTALLPALKIIPGIIENQSGRKIIILLTDGQNTVTGTKVDDVIEELNKNDVVVLTLGTTDIRSSPFGESENIVGPPATIPTSEALKAKALLRTLAKKTGGYSYFPVEAKELPRIMEKFRHILRSQYVLGFMPGKSAANSKRKIEVRCIRKDVKLRYRQNYSD